VLLVLQSLGLQFQYRGELVQCLEENPHPKSQFASSINCFIILGAFAKEKFQGDNHSILTEAPVK
jgi:hypothetical protein